MMTVSRTASAAGSIGSKGLLHIRILTMNHGRVTSAALNKRMWKTVRVNASAEKCLVIAAWEKSDQHPVDCVKKLEGHVVLVNLTNAEDPSMNVGHVLDALR